MNNQEYRQQLIKEILDYSSEYTFEMLKNKPTKALEKICDSL